MSNNHGFIKKNNIFYVYKCFVTSVEKNFVYQYLTREKFLLKVKR